jgi:hypothetical protein
MNCRQGHEPLAEKNKGANSSLPPTEDKMKTCAPKLKSPLSLELPPSGNSKLVALRELALE